MGAAPPIPTDQPPTGVVGCTSTVTDLEADTACTVQRTALRFTHHDEPGLLPLSVTNHTDHPASLTPQDLIDAALTRADATLGPTSPRTRPPHWTTTPTP